MITQRIPRWIGAVVLAALGVAALALFVVAWISANQIRSDLLVPVADERSYDIEILRTPPARLVIAGTDEPPRGGIWGFESGATYTQLTALLLRTGTETEWAATPYIGEPAVGVKGRVDVDAYPVNPDVAFGLGFESVRAPGDLGPLPAWLIDGRRSTWVIIVHGRGTDRRTQALRMIPRLVESGYPVLVVSYRNDDGAPKDPSGLRSWGLTEWRDLDAAVRLAEREGARDYFLVGHDLGAEVVSTFLHESDRVGNVLGVVFDSPALDLEGTMDYDSGPVEQFVDELGQQLARIRFGMEWSEFDQVARADQFDVPILALHGARDETIPIEITEAFAAARPDLVQFLRFEQGGHGDLWNVDTARYEAAVMSFVDGLADTEG
ncbi:MAG: alpha/beta hydrolase [Acidimicrobiia bacterium]